MAKLNEGETTEFINFLASNIFDANNSKEAWSEDTRLALGEQVALDAQKFLREGDFASAANNFRVLAQVYARYYVHAAKALALATGWE